MNKIYFFRGLPGSGKTTQAHQMVKDSKTPIIRVNKDDLRAMLHNGVWSKDNEQTVLDVRDVLITGALRGKSDVIVDDTNLVDKHLESIKFKARVFNAAVEVIDLRNVPINTCIERDAARAKPVGVKVITRMWRDHIKPLIKPPTYNHILPDAIICDLDGTLALLNGRNPYDASTCENDTLNAPVAFAISRHYNYEQSVLLVSGREEKDRTPTETFLAKHDIFYNKLWMRATGDHRPDTVIKREIYDNHIKDRYNVIACYDDRPCMVRMWREMGLFVFDVGDGVEF